VEILTQEARKKQLLSILNRYFTREVAQEVVDLVIPDAVFSTTSLSMCDIPAMTNCTSCTEMAGAVQAEAEMWRCKTAGLQDFHDAVARALQQGEAHGEVKLMATAAMTEMLRTIDTLLHDAHQFREMQESLKQFIEKHKNSPQRSLWSP
jgi:hypothetical protein